MCSRAAPFNALALNWPSAGAALAPDHLVVLALFGPEITLSGLPPLRAASREGCFLRRPALGFFKAYGPPRHALPDGSMGFL